MTDSILCITNLKKQLLGTGFVVESNEEYSLVLTCGHVVGQCVGNSDLYVNNEVVEVIKNQYEDGIDLALLKINKTYSALNIGTECSEEVDVHVEGYSLFSGKIKREAIKNITVKCGISFKLESDGSEVLAMKLYPSEPISQGYSGAPVLCSKTNQVLGLVHLQTGEKQNYALTGQQILDFYNPVSEKIIASKKICFSKKPILDITIENKVLIEEKFKSLLDDALRSFAAPNVWVEPSIYTIQENQGNSESESKEFTVSNVVAKPDYLCIRAQPQYGLTSLSNVIPPFLTDVKSRGLSRV